MMGTFYTYRATLLLTTDKFNGRRYKIVGPEARVSLFAALSIGTRMHKDNEKSKLTYFAYNLKNHSLISICLPVYVGINRHGKDTRCFDLVFI